MDASFKKAGTGYILAIERHFPHAPKKVWRVLTERELIKQWFPCDIEGDWEVGAELRFHFMNGEDAGMSEEELRGEVLSVDPPSVLEFSWCQSVIRCELTAADDGCVLHFSETLDDPSAGARNSAGWELCLESLSAITSGVTLAKFSWDVWRSKFSHYVKKFEPEFGPQQGPPSDHPAGDES